MKKNDKIDFKLKFPTGFSIKDETNDNIDVNVILSTGDVYFATFFTFKNVLALTKKEKEKYFWATNMILIEDLEMDTLESVVRKMIKDLYFYEAFSKIGNIGDIYSNVLFEEL